MPCGVNWGCSVEASATRYIGRFAPSPTGPLHLGSLVAAVGSYLDARAHQGIWRLRMEDVDSPRCIPGAADQILHALESFEFSWDGPVVVQSQRLAAYQDALSGLQSQQWVYPCFCSRKKILSYGVRTSVDGSRVYPGVCRLHRGHDGATPPERSPAWRLQVPDEIHCFEDRFLGPQTQNLARDVGDFVLFRADGLFAYQLAVVVDDGWQGITDVVRGSDLLVSTARQIWLQRCLGLPTPRYGHLPLVCNAAGEKLSKQTRAPALLLKTASEKIRQLIQAMGFLGLPVSPVLQDASLAELWRWGVDHWARKQKIIVPDNHVHNQTG